MNDVVAILLAGGAGKRFWPITIDKNLLTFLDKPLILYTLEALRDAGLERIIIVTNPRNYKAIKRVKIRKLKLEVIIQKKPLGMANALLVAKSRMKGKSILVVNGADIVEKDLFRSVLEKGTKTNQVVIPGLEKKEYFPGGYLKTRGKQVTEIVEKPGEGKQPSNLVNVVVHFFPEAHSLMGLLQESKKRKDDDYEVAVSKLIRKEPAVYIRYKGSFGFVKYPWDILSMMQLILENELKNKISRSAKIHKSAIVEGPVLIEDGAQVLEHAVIKGPAYVGKNTVIGTNALLVKSMLERNCVVGFSSEVTRSYLGSSCWLHTNYIGDSVLEGRNYFGAGAVTANFRFDEAQILSIVNGVKLNTKRTKLGAIVGREARIGVNASLMPGVKIGSGALVGPGSVQYQDVGEK